MSQVLSRGEFGDVVTPKPGAHFGEDNENERIAQALAVVRAANIQVNGLGATT